MFYIYISYNIDNFLNIKSDFLLYEALYLLLSSKIKHIKYIKQSILIGIYMIVSQMNQVSNK